MDRSRTEIESIIEEWVLNGQSRQMLKYKLLDGLGYEAIAEKLGVSPKTVQRAMNRWLKVVKFHM